MTTDPETQAPHEGATVTLPNTLAALAASGVDPAAVVAQFQQPSPAPADPLEAALQSWEQRLAVLESVLNVTVPALAGAVPALEPAASRLDDIEAAINRLVPVVNATAPLIAGVVAELRPKG
jgi:hypothetical protein